MTAREHDAARRLASHSVSRARIQPAFETEASAWCAIEWTISARGHDKMLDMSSLTLRDIGLKPTQMRAVARRAKKAGKTPSEYVRSLVERDLMAGDSFDEVLKPIRQGFHESGMTEDQLDEFVAEARKAHRTHARRKPRK